MDKSIEVGHIVTSINTICHVYAKDFNLIHLHEGDERFNNGFFRSHNDVDLYTDIFEKES